MKLKMDGKTDKQLRKAKYGVFNHSAVQICAWTKRSLHNDGVCYKQKFYGIPTHRCMEFSPAAAFCENNCVFCWRPTEFMRFRRMKAKEADEPETIYENLITERRKLLSGFPGDGNTDMKKHAEAMLPIHFAISLSGEPTLYPKLPQLVKFLKALPQTKSVFIVTNGQEPDALVKLAHSPPTQLYISVNAPDRTLFKRINCPVYKDAWDRFLKSLGILSRMKTRRILRMTMIKGMNMDAKFISGYASLIRRAKPHFVEVKAYMWIGFSQRRLKKENMPFHKDVRAFAEKLAKEIDFEITNETTDSRVVLLKAKSPHIRTLI